MNPITANSREFAMLMIKTHYQLIAIIYSRIICLLNPIIKKNIQSLVWIGKQLYIVVSQIINFPFDVWLAFT